MTAAAAAPDVDRDRTYLPPAAPDVAPVIDLVAALNARGLTTTHVGPRLIAADGREVPLPHNMVEVLLQVAQAMTAGLAVTVAPQHLTLSTQEAADLLGVARTTLVRLLEAGEIAYEKPGRHRKVRLVDLMAYRDRQRYRAEEALAEMVADTERLGLYETDPESVRAAIKAARRARTRS